MTRRARAAASGSGSRSASASAGAGSTGLAACAFESASCAHVHSDGAATEPASRRAPAGLPRRHSSIARSRRRLGRTETARAAAGREQQRVRLGQPSAPPERARRHGQGAGAPRRRRARRRPRRWRRRLEAPRARGPHHGEPEDAREDLAVVPRQRRPEERDRERRRDGGGPAGLEDAARGVLVPAAAREHERGQPRARHAPGRRGGRGGVARLGDRAARGSEVDRTQRVHRHGDRRPIGGRVAEPGGGVGGEAGERRLGAVDGVGAREEPRGQRGGVAVPEEALAAADVVGARRRRERGRARGAGGGGDGPSRRRPDRGAERHPLVVDEARRAHAGPRRPSARGAPRGAGPRRSASGSTTPT